VPIDAVRAARSVAKRRDADCYVAIGGGSTIGLAKAMALDYGLPIVAVPTTYAGSEMTAIYNVTEEGLLRTGRDIKALPKTVVYDPSLTWTLPPAASGSSGMAALAHCVEGLYTEHVNPIITLLALEGIRALSRALPVVVRQPDNAAGRSDALYGAWLGGCVLGAVGMCIHHKICDVLSSTFHLPYADTHAVILSHAVAFNRDAAPEAMVAAADALAVSDAAQGIYGLTMQLGAPVALKDIGMSADELDRAARMVSEHPNYNPRPAEYASVRRLLDNAYRGDPPA
jgi:maleylacetate reductase